MPAIPAEVIGAAEEQGFEPGRELGHEIVPGVRPAGALLLEPRAPVAPVLVEVRAFGDEGPQELLLAGGMRHLALTAVQLDHRPGHDQLAGRDPGFGEVLEEDGLVGKDVGVVSGEVVHRVQVVVEEGGRTGAREHVRGVDPLDVLPGAGHLVDAFDPRQL